MITFLVAGTRSDFMKIAPIARAFDSRPELSYKIIHTGQHYDKNMSHVFFEELGIRPPDFQLNASINSHARRFSAIMSAFEDVCLEKSPDLVMVMGGVDSTAATAFVAKKLGIRVAHVEAGFRSFDQSIPEEINQVTTDALSDIFFVSESQCMVNLKKEGKLGSSIHFTGSVMIDNLLYQLARLDRIPEDKLKGSHLKNGSSSYGIVTLHRPCNVDNPAILTSLFETLEQIAGQVDLIFPIHPRTLKNMKRFGIRAAGGITLLEPLSYMSFLNLMKDACVALTDSGGLQEETTALGIPCLTLRDNTERPVTVSQGTNALVGTSCESIMDAFEAIMAGEWKIGQQPHFWDGRAARRIAELIMIKEFKLN